MGVALPRVERDEMRFLSPPEVATLAEAIDARYRAMVFFDAYCGLRLGELASHLERYGEPGPDALVFVGPDGGALRANGCRARHWRPAIKPAGDLRRLA